MVEEGKKNVCSEALPFCVCLAMVIGLINKDILPPSLLAQNRNNMWQHEIHCDTSC